MSNHEWNRQPVRTQLVHLYKDEVDSELWNSIMRKLKCEGRNPICDTDLIGLELKVIAHEHFKIDE